MTLLLIAGLLVGFQTGQVVTKKELAKDKAYFCYVEEKIKRCFEVQEDSYARQEFIYRKY